MAAKNAKKQQAQAPEVAADVLRYTKADLLNSKRFRHQRDLITALLDENKTYAIEEAEALIGRFLKGQVN